MHGVESKLEAGASFSLYTTHCIQAGSLMDARAVLQLSLAWTVYSP